MTVSFAGNGLYYLSWKDVGRFRGLFDEYLMSKSRAACAYHVSFDLPRRPVNRADSSVLFRFDGGPFWAHYIEV